MTLSITPAAKIPRGRYQLLVLVNGQQAKQSPTIDLF